MRRESLPLALALALPLLAGATPLATENYGARAEMLAPDGRRHTAPLTISIDRTLTNEERAVLLAAFKSGDAKALRKALGNQPSLGYVDRGRVRLQIKFASSRPSGKGKMVTMVCDEPMTYVGGDVPDVAPRPGFDLTYVLLSLDAEGNGTGEIAPAAKMRVRDDGSLSVADYGAPIIDLEDVAREK